MIALLRSMTGFGRGEGTVQGRHIICELKSVNHKYFELNARITRGYLFLEDRLKAYLQSRLSRGKVDVFLQVENLEESGAQVQVNHALAEGYYSALMELKERCGLSDGPSLALLSRYPDVFTVHKAPEDEDAVWQAVLQVAGPAADSLLRMREAEGARLRTDIAGKAENILALVERVERLAPQAVSDYRERLQNRIQELLGSSRFYELGGLAAGAVFACKSAVDEETVRLRSHFF